MIAKTYACSLPGIDAILVIRLVNNTADYHVNGSRESPSAIIWSFNLPPLGGRYPARVGGRAAEGTP
jgi:hypothetical protein